MTLGELLKGVPLRGALSAELASREVEGLDYDSRRSGPGYVFFAFAGAKADGREFAKDAVEKGAIAVLSELAAPPGFAGAWIEVEHGRKALSAAARAFYRDPDQRLKLIGITGTNGKTTTAYVIEAMLRASGNVTGMIGTIEYRMGEQVSPSVNTTPESLDLVRFADQLLALGGTHLVAEISSHALALGRVSGFHFDTAVFTNLTRDHQDFHQTMEAYRDAKRLLFAPLDGPAPRHAVINVDDPAHRSMLPGPETNTVLYGLSAQAALRAVKVQAGFEGTQFEITWQGKRQKVSSPLLGEINVSNLLAAAGAGLASGLELDAIAAGLAKCTAVPGRFERVDAGQPFLVVVDYAHTDDALRNAIKVARGLLKSANGRVITLFGCGGDRDRTKRPLMGQAAGELSDYVVLTSDNPRSEEPLNIMNDAMVGLGRFDTPHAAELDRAQGIRIAIEQARPGDVVLVAGKGHETYQILKDRTIHFDDRETARDVLRSLGYGS